MIHRMCSVLTTIFHLRSKSRGVGSCNTTLLNTINNRLKCRGENMVYYRLAFLKPQTTLWHWKTTVLISLQAVSQWLRIYSFLPQDQIRVFSAPSKKNLEEMLQRENRGLPSGSITAEQFLRARHIQVYYVTRNTPILETTEQNSCSSTTFVAHTPA